MDRLSRGEYWAMRRAREAVRIEERIINGELVQVKVYPPVFKKAMPMDIEITVDGKEEAPLKPRWRFRKEG